MLPASGGGGGAQNPSALPTKASSLKSRHSADSPAFKSRIPRSPSIIGVTVGSEYTWRQVHPPAPGRRDSPAVFRHQHIGNDDLQALRLEKADRVDRPPQRAWNFGDRVMHLGPVRVNADLNRFHSQITQARCLRFADQHRIGLQLDAEDRRR